jgi:hypothetical protein
MSSVVRKRSLTKEYEEEKKKTSSFGWAPVERHLKQKSCCNN